MKCRFNPLWINTALKLQATTSLFLISFNPLWINTALKPDIHNDPLTLCFNPLWINTALKQLHHIYLLLSVSIPYGLTLLSN